VRDRIGRVGDRDPNIFARQSRIRIEEIGVSGSFRKLPKQKLDRKFASL
jgi:hypothetical protein